MDEDRNQGETHIHRGHGFELQALVVARPPRGPFPAPVRPRKAAHPVDQGKPGTDFAGLQTETADKEGRLPLVEPGAKESYQRKYNQQVTERAAAREGYNDFLKIGRLVARLRGEGRVMRTRRGARCAPRFSKCAPRDYRRHKAR